MKKSLGVKEWLYPEPVLIIGTYDENGDPDAMNAAWGGIADTAQVTLCLSPEHKTVKNLLKTKCFTVSPAVAEAAVQCDYVGIASGNNTMNKMFKSGFTCVRSQKVNAPLFEELPFALECELISYDPETCRCLGRIVDVVADEKILKDGKIDMTKFNPLIYDGCNQTYHKFGEVVGKAFSIGFALR